MDSPRHRDVAAAAVRHRPGPRLVCRGPGQSARLPSTGRPPNPTRTPASPRPCSRDRGERAHRDYSRRQRSTVPDGDRGRDEWRLPHRFRTGAVGFVDALQAYASKASAPPDTTPRTQRRMHTAAEKVRLLYVACTRREVTLPCPDIWPPVCWALSSPTDSTTPTPSCPNSSTPAAGTKTPHRSRTAELGRLAGRNRTGG